MGESDVFIGRGKECRLIAGFLGQRKNILVYGDEGVGKTALIKKVFMGQTRLKYLYSQESGTLKETLENLITYSSGGEKKSIHRLTILNQKRMTYRILDNCPDYILLDHIGVVSPCFQSFLEYLLDRGIALVVVSKGLASSDIGHLWEGAYAFEKVRICNLGKSSSIALAEHYLESLGIAMGSDNEFKKDIFHYSHGNPKVIIELCSLAKENKYRRDGRFDFKLMDLDRRIMKMHF